MLVFFSDKDVSGKKHFSSVVRRKQTLLFKASVKTVKFLGGENAIELVHSVENVLSF